MRKEISNRVKKASFCSVMAYTMPDVSHSDEMSVALRFINADTSEPEERLVRIMETKDKTGLGSANYIIKCHLSDIPLEEVMFQTYDSAANICGKFNGARPEEYQRSAWKKNTLHKMHPTWRGRAWL